MGLFQAFLLLFGASVLAIENIKLTFNGVRSYCPPPVPPRECPFINNTHPALRIKAEGLLKCGVVNFPPYAIKPVLSGGDWTGLEIDLCKAIAASIFGAAVGKVGIVETTQGQKYADLKAGKFDVGFGATERTVHGEVQESITFANPPYRFNSVVTVASSSRGFFLANRVVGSVCVSLASSSALRAADFFAFTPAASVTPLVGPAVWSGFFSGSCAAAVAPIEDFQAELASRSLQASDYQVLTPFIWVRPIAAFVRPDDHALGEIVGAVINNLQLAHELGIDSRNYQSFTPRNTEQSKYKGTDPVAASIMKLDPLWRQNSVRDAGNSEEIERRSFGQPLPPNTIVSKGGLFAPASI